MIATFQLTYEKFVAIFYVCQADPGYTNIFCSYYNIFHLLVKSEWNNIEMKVHVFRGNHRLMYRRGRRFKEHSTVTRSPNPRKQSLKKRSKAVCKKKNTQTKAKFSRQLMEMSWISQVSIIGQPKKEKNCWTHIILWCVIVKNQYHMHR